MKDSDMYGLALAITSTGLLILMDAKFSLAVISIYFFVLLARALKKEGEHERSN